MLEAVALDKFFKLLIVKIFFLFLTFFLVQKSNKKGHFSNAFSSHTFLHVKITFAETEIFCPLSLTFLRKIFQCFSALIFLTLVIFTHTLKKKQKVSNIIFMSLKLLTIK